MLKSYFKSLYQRTMHEAYARARREIIDSLQGAGKCLDCGAHSGHEFDISARDAGY